MDLSAGDPVTGPVRAGDLLWTPTPQRVASANMTAFMSWLKDTRGLEFTHYPDLWQWSVTETDAFWQAIWDYNDIIADAAAGRGPRRQRHARRGVVPRRPAQLRART